MSEQLQMQFNRLQMQFNQLKQDNLLLIKENESYKNKYEQLKAKLIENDDYKLKWQRLKNLINNEF